MAIVFTMKAGEVLYADEVPLIKITRITSKCVWVASCGAVMLEVQCSDPEYTSSLRVSEASDVPLLKAKIISEALGIDIMATKVNIGNDRRSSVRMSCQSTDKNIKFSYNL